MRYLLLLLWLVLPTACTRSAPAPTPTVSPSVVSIPIGFASERKWHEHFSKHGADFKCQTAEEYYPAMAQQLRDAPLSEQILEARRPDGALTRFDRSTGAFLACSANGTIRTFFRPHDGEAYFRRQLRKDH